MSNREQRFAVNTTSVIFPSLAYNRNILGITFTGPSGGFTLLVGGVPVDVTDTSASNSKQYSGLNWPMTQEAICQWNNVGSLSATLEWETAND